MIDVGTGNTQTFCGALPNVAVGYMKIITFDNNSTRISCVPGIVIIERGGEFDDHKGGTFDKYGT